jgi:hypothetical protein
MTQSADIRASGIYKPSTHFKLGHGQNGVQNGHKSRNKTSKQGILSDVLCWNHFSRLFRGSEGTNLVPERFASPDRLFESPLGGLRKKLCPSHRAHIESRPFLF